MDRVHPDFGHFKCASRINPTCVVKLAGDTLQAESNGLEMPQPASLSTASSSTAAPAARWSVVSSRTLWRSPDARHEDHAGRAEPRHHLRVVAGARGCRQATPDSTYMLR
jgi:hypothetical protein